MHPTVVTDQHIDVFPDHPEATMTKTLSRKSSTVFQPMAAQDPLPPLPSNAASLAAGFADAMPPSNRHPRAMDAYYQYLCSALDAPDMLRDGTRHAQQSVSDIEDELNLQKLKLLTKLEQTRIDRQARMDALRSKVNAATTVKAPASSRKEPHGPAAYTKPYCDYMTNNPTIFHAVDAVARELEDNGFEKLSERKEWDIQKGGKYYVERNGSSLIAFEVGAQYKSGNGAAVIAGHIDALTARLKPVSQVPNKAGYTQLGVAPYAGALNSTWWDRDLGIGGRVLVKEGDKVVSKLVKLDRAIARIPTLAPHFGTPANGPFNQETQMVPIIGLESAGDSTPDPKIFKAGTFAATQPPRLVRAIADELGISASGYSNIVQWELELFDFAPAVVGGLDREFIFAGRIDDKLCSWAAIQGLLNSVDDSSSGLIKVVGLFDDEEIGSLLRQGARGNFLPSTIERIVATLVPDEPSSVLLGRTFANSFLVSSDVCHAVNPNFLNVYLENHSPQLNVGVTVSADSNGHMTTDSMSTALFTQCVEKDGAKVQVFQIRNDSRSGGTVGPMMSSATGMRAIDVGIPQLSMHSIRATTGSLDPGLGVQAFQAFLDHFEEVDRAYE